MSDQATQKDSTVLPYVLGGRNDPHFQDLGGNFIPDRIEANEDNYGYPRDWPSCPSCGMPALDGHITCGRLECDEGAWR